MEGCWRSKDFVFILHRYFFLLFLHLFVFSLSIRYCKPFEEEARRLAKTLVAVGDLLEVWQAAQADISLLLSAAVSSLIEGSSNLRVKHRQVKRR